MVYSANMHQDCERGVLGACSSGEIFEIEVL